MAQLGSLRRCFSLLALTFAVPGLAHASTELWRETFDGPALDTSIKTQNARAQVTMDVEHSGNFVEVVAEADKRGTFAFDLGDPGQACGALGGVAVDLRNPDDAPVEISLTAEGKTASGKRLRLRAKLTLQPGAWNTFPLYFFDGIAGPYWGMQGIPCYGPVDVAWEDAQASGKTLEQIREFAIQVEGGQSGATVHVDNARLFDRGTGIVNLVPHPFIDRFGQFMHADWPGKVHSEDELRQIHEAEAQSLAAASQVAGMDRFGGWADGPRREATGFFRTEKVDGKWWLVTPDGTLFFSIGVNCVRAGDSTFIDGRDGWFEGLPEPDGPLQACFGHVSGVHSRAEPINGTGRSFNFLQANLMRVYGENWFERQRDTAYARMRAWGWNTLGNWSDGSIMANSPIPFTVSGGSARPRAVEGSEGYWGKLVDVYDPEFAPQTEAGLRALAERYRDNPLVVGYFVDNEMSWAGVARGVLASPPDQPARSVFIEALQTQYGTLQALNTAWGIRATDWHALRVPNKMNATCQEDIETYEYRFARRYFDTINDALKRYDPNHLYLGCRFTLAYCPDPVVRACAEVVDVFSVNAYVTEFPADRFTGLDKPFMIGEFHFGARDRGMFHTGLQAVEDQAARAAAYVHYLENAATNPLLVGCHWFQYFDEPTTGRTLDGENFNIGLVSTADIPYAELVTAARDVHGRLYPLRAGMSAATTTSR